MTGEAAEVCSVAKWWNTTPRDVYGWEWFEYQDAVEYMHIAWEAEERRVEELGNQ